MPDTTNPAAGAEDTSGDKPARVKSTARDGEFSSIQSAMSELDRLDGERTAQRKAKKAAKEVEASDEDDADVEDGRKPPERREQDEAEKPQRKAKADDADEESEDDDGDTDEDEDRTEDKDSDRDADEADDDGDDKPEQKADDKPPAKIKLKVEGKEVEATPDQVTEYVEHVTKAGHEVTRQRQNVEQASQQLQQAHQQFAQQSEVLANLAQAVIGQEPDISLLHTDQQSYLIQKDMYAKRVGVYQQLMQLAQSAATQAHEQTRQQNEAQRTAGAQALLRAMPELADPSKRAAFQGRAYQVAQEYGFGQQAIEQISHPGFFQMLRDLGRWRDSEKAKSEAKKKLANAPSKAMGPQATTPQRERSARDSTAAKKDFLRGDRSLRSARRALDRM